MLSPDDIFPVVRSGRTASIWSFDSGYASGMVEEEELERDLPTQSHNITPVALKHPSSRSSIGLGISGLWNIHGKNQLRTPKEPVVEPFTTRLNVYTARDQTNHRYSLPPQAIEPRKCITCDLWDITNPGQNIKCEECLEIAKSTKVHASSTNYPLTPRLEISETPEAQPSPTPTRCACGSIRSARRPCKKCAANSGLLSPVSPATSEVRRSRAGRSSKLSAAALKRLQSWLDANRDHPYPTPEAKASLAQECGITVKQVCTWFTNTRARHLKAPEDRSPKVEHEEEHISGGSTPRDSSFYGSEYTNDQLIITPHRSPGMEAGPSQLQPSRRGRKKDYRRNNATSPAMVSPVQPSCPESSAEASETWQCTFCRQNLAPKSWRRHEETQHRPKYTWVCLASGPTVIPRRNSAPICALCGLQNPTADHCYSAHRMFECAHKTEDERTFLRPDHLRQHVKNFHKTTLLESVRDMWRRDGPGKNTNEGWVCGICDENLHTWDIRETHIANHFKDGLTMADWKTPPMSSQAEEAASTHTLPEFDFGPPLTDNTLAEWDFNFDNSFGLVDPPVCGPVMQQPVSGITYDAFQDQAAMETNIGFWAGNIIDYQNPW